MICVAMACCVLHVRGPEHFTSGGSLFVPCKGIQSARVKFKVGLRLPPCSARNARLRTSGNVAAERGDGSGGVSSAVHHDQEVPDPLEVWGISFLGCAGLVLELRI